MPDPDVEGMPANVRLVSGRVRLWIVTDVTVITEEEK